MLGCSDAELVEAARGGDVDSLGELYRRHYVPAVGIAYCVLSDYHLAEDAAQEAFAVACRDLDRLRRVEKFASWLGAICRIAARRLAKAKSRRALPPEIPAPPQANSGDERAAAVQQSLNRLPQSAREVIVLRYYSGLSHEQIAATLGISPQAVHGRLIRARRKVADILSRNGFGGTV